MEKIKHFLSLKKKKKKKTQKGNLQKSIFV
jgi:hypothetical protein